MRDIFDEEIMDEVKEAMRNFAKAINEAFNESMKTLEELAKHMPASPQPPTGRERFKGLVEGKNKRDKYRLK